MELSTELIQAHFAQRVETWKLLSNNFPISGRHRSRCFLPKAWHGEYFHLGYNSPLLVGNTSIEGKGRCVENFGSHFVMEDEEYGEKCWRCMTMYRKHQNVLSYKESELSNWGRSEPELFWHWFPSFQVIVRHILTLSRLFVLTSLATLRCTQCSDERQSRSNAPSRAPSCSATPRAGLALTSAAAPSPTWTPALTTTGCSSTSRRA